VRHRAKRQKIVDARPIAAAAPKIVDATAAVAAIGTNAVVIVATAAATVADATAADAAVAAMAEE
jgi:hypothetical protein